eukprot:15431018-Alexandrium_andersonii.AAC.1
MEAGGALHPALSVGVPWVAGAPLVPRGWRGSRGGRSPPLSALLREPPAQQDAPAATTDRRGKRQ